VKPAQSQTVYDIGVPLVAGRTSRYSIPAVEHQWTFARKYFAGPHPVGCTRDGDDRSARPTPQTWKCRRGERFDKVQDLRTMLTSGLFACWQDESFRFMPSIAPVRSQQVMQAVRRNECGSLTPNFRGCIIYLFAASTSRSACVKTDGWLLVHLIGGFGAWPLPCGGNGLYGVMPTRRARRTRLASRGFGAFAGDRHMDGNAEQVLS